MVAMTPSSLVQMLHGNTGRYSVLMVAAVLWRQRITDLDVDTESDLIPFSVADLECRRFLPKTERSTNYAGGDPLKLPDLCQGGTAGASDQCQ